MMQLGVGSNRNQIIRDKNIIVKGVQLSKRSQLGRAKDGGRRYGESCTNLFTPSLLPETC